MDEFYAYVFGLSTYTSRIFLQTLLLGKHKPGRPSKKPSPHRRNQPKAMARAIRIFLALDLLPETDFFVSPNIYDARLLFFLTIGLGENRLML